MGGASAIGQVVTWSVTIIVARLLTPEDYGLVAISGLFTVFAHSICLLGISAAVVQADVVTDYQIRALYGLSVLMGAVMFCVGLAAAPIMAWGFDDERLVGLVVFQSAVLLFGAPKSLLWSLHARETRFDQVAKVETASRILTSLCTLTAAALGAGYWALAAQWILIEGLQFAAFIWLKPILPTFRIKFAEINDLLRFGVGVFLRNSIGQLYASVDVMIYGKLASQGFLGGYSFAKQLTGMPFEKIVRIINVVLMPYLSQRKGDQGAMREWSLKVAELETLILAPFFFVLFFCADEAVFLLLGEGWSIAVFPLQIFCIANVFKLAESYTGVALTALGLVTTQIRFVLIQLISVGISLLVLALWGGIELSLYVWVTIHPVICLFYTKVLLKRIDLSFKEVFMHIKGILIAQALMVATLALLESHLHGSMLHNVAIKIIAAMLMYSVGLILLDRKRSIHRINLLLSGVRSRA